MGHVRINRIRHFGYAVASYGHVTVSALLRLVYIKKKNKIHRRTLLRYSDGGSSQLITTSGSCLRRFLRHYMTSASFFTDDKHAVAMLTTSASDSAMVRTRGTDNASASGIGNTSSPFSLCGGD